jgi:addiction module HigA family antidote
MQKMTRRPTHPGTIIKEDYLSPLSISINDMAANLNVSRKTLSKIINGRGSVTADMALRLARAFDTTPEMWMNLQTNYDLWQTEHSSNGWQAVKPLPPELLHSH